MLTNLGIPASVLSPAIHQIAQANGRDIPANFVDRELPFVPVNTTLVTIFRGANDTNALAEAIDKGAAGNDLRATLPRRFVRSAPTTIGSFAASAPRAADAFIIVVNVPNMAGLPYASAYSVSRRQVKLQAIAVGFARGGQSPGWRRRGRAGYPLRSAGVDRGRFSSDGFHPNDTGYAYLAERLLAIVNGATPPVAASCSQMVLVPAL